MATFGIARVWAGMYGDKSEGQIVVTDAKKNIYITIHEGSLGTMTAGMVAMLENSMVDDWCPSNSLTIDDIIGKE